MLISFPDLLQNNQLLSIYPIRAQTSTSSTSNPTTATDAPIEITYDDLMSEDYFDDRQREETFPRWQNFPFSAESIQVRQVSSFKMSAERNKEQVVCKINSAIIT